MGARPSTPGPESASPLVWVVVLCSDAYDADDRAARVVLLTECDEFPLRAFDRIREFMRGLEEIVDARNLLDPAAMRLVASSISCRAA